jgi:hypothetical protein
MGACQGHHHDHHRASVVRARRSEGRRAGAAEWSCTTSPGVGDPGRSCARGRIRLRTTEWSRTTSPSFGNSGRNCARRHVRGDQGNRTLRNRFVRTASPLGELVPWQIVGALARSCTGECVVCNHVPSLSWLRALVAECGGPDGNRTRTAAVRGQLHPIRPRAQNSASDGNRTRLKVIDSHLTSPDRSGGILFGARAAPSTGIEPASK